ncbi:MAG: hypothetical protein CEE40_04420 [Chloroflexi bacterium B3_Chlor]|nr:MAG: hypothetical protein CEE40_04420 [Chloroflexi bacterium B3_Chlor]
MTYHPFVTRVVPNMLIRRERLLPLRGEVLVTTGQRVQPSNIIARTIVPSGIHLLNVAKALAVDSTDFSRHMRVGIGDRVAEGDVLAGGGGVSRFFGRAYRSPIGGVVAGTSNGRVLIQSSSSTLELAAHYRGTVINVMSGLGAIIEIRGALVQGVWGSDKEGFGVLKLVVDDPAKAIDPKAIDVTCRGTVLAGAFSVGEEALYRAQQMEIQGIVVGGLDTRLQDLVHSMPFPVVVTEGMGRFAICRPIFDLLQAYEGQEASIRGTIEARGGAVRPEIIIYVPRTDEGAEPEARPKLLLERGSQVRIVRGPHMGETGEVVDCPLHARQLPTGASGRGVEVRLESSEEVLVAQANVELFG